MGPYFSSSKTITLDDGTECGQADDVGNTFANAIQRMHSLVPGCEEELRAYSETGGTKSANAILERLEECQRRRGNQLTALEAACGPSQEAFKVCIAATSKPEQCAGVLDSFLDCAARALAKSPPR